MRVEKLQTQRRGFGREQWRSMDDHVSDAWPDSPHVEKAVEGTAARWGLRGAVVLMVSFQEGLVAVAPRLGVVCVPRLTGREVRRSGARGPDGAGLVLAGPVASAGLCARRRVLGFLFSVPAASFRLAIRQSGRGSAMSRGRWEEPVPGRNQ